MRNEICELVAAAPDDDGGFATCKLASLPGWTGGPVTPPACRPSLLSPDLLPPMMREGRAGPHVRAERIRPMPDILAQIEAEIPHLRRFARYLARDVDRGDDLVQECLTRAIAKQHTWTPGTNLRAWLFTILKNCHINDVRRARQTDEMPDEHPLLTVQANQDAHIRLLEVRDAYLQLSDEHREVLLLVAIEGLQYDEAAAILKVPVGTVRSRLSRARQALRDALEDGGGTVEAVTPLPSAVS